MVTDKGLGPLPETDNGRGPTVYFDGSCPLCSMEIRHYTAQEGGKRLNVVDVSQDDAALGSDLTKNAAMARFHVRSPDGQLLSGASAFVAIWETLPGWRWAARLASLPGAPILLESGYRLFLLIRPVLSGLLKRSARPTG